MVSVVTSTILTLSLMGTVFCQCEEMSGDWYDAATEDVMTVSVVGCQMTSKYGTASVMDGKLVKPTNGILQTLKITGNYDNRIGTIKWSNGIRWIRSLTSEMRERIEILEHRLNGVDELIAKLFTCTSCDSLASSIPRQPKVTAADVEQLADQIRVLNETISDVNQMCSSNCSSQSMTTNSTDVMQLVDQIKELNETIMDVNSSKCVTCSMATNSTDVMQLADRMQQLNETIMDVNSSKCTSYSGQSMPTNSTDVVYIMDQIKELNGSIMDVNNSKCSSCSGQSMPTNSTDVMQLVDQIKELNETIMDVNSSKCTSCSGQSMSTNSTDVMQLADRMQQLNETIMDVNSSKCSSCSGQSMPTNATDVTQLVDQIKELNETIMNVNSSKCVTCSMATNSTDIMQLADRIQELNETIVDVNNTKQCSSCGSTSTELKEITNSVEILNRTISDMNSTTGRDGYCTIEPNVTDVYVPVTRYVHRVSGNIANKCTVGGPAWRGGSANKDAASMMTRSEIDDTNCRWGAQMSREPMLAYKGDTIVFWRNGGIFTTLYEFEDEKAFTECDFDRSTLLASLQDFSALETVGKNYTLVADKSGPRFFGSDVEGDINPDRKINCWDPDVAYPGPGQFKNGVKGKAMKIMVMVLNPTEEVLAICPLYDPSKYGISGGQEVDSATVQKLKGTVAAIGRQLISMEVHMAQRKRSEGQSGLSVVRSVRGGTNAYHTASYSEGGAAASHNHANTHHTIGMGEFEAVLNGVQFTTRHNDFSLLEPNDTLSVYEYTNTWPPESKSIKPAPVPPSVLNAGSVPNQINEMKEYFRAFKTQNVTHRDYRPYFRPILCYLEGAWTESQENIAEPFSSERHHIDADSWTDLNEKMNYLVNSGQKNNLENLPYLPTAFRGMRTDGEDTFEPIVAQWFYRISCKKLDHDIPIARMRVVNDVHNQFRQTLPATMEEMESTPAPIFEFNPTSEADFDPVDPWPKDKVKDSYLDYVMGKIPGFDGPKGNLLDNSFGFKCEDNNGKVLNTAFYNRYYNIAEKDAMGNTQRKRSFNDGYMFAAQTSNKKVSPQTVCAEFDPSFVKEKTADDLKREAECVAMTKKDCGKEWKGDLGHGAERATCSVSLGKCVYKKCWTQRWTYAIPLEIIYQNPLIEWNPYNIIYHSGDSGAKEVTTGGRNGKKGKAYNGSSHKLYFRTPASMFNDRKDINNADTSGGLTYVLDKNGKEREVVASGHWINIPEVQGIPGTIRQRYPVFPVHEHGSTSWKEVKALQEMVVNKEDEHVKKILEEIRISAYGAELRLKGGGHDHVISITPKELRELKAGVRTQIEKTSSVAEAHSHRVLVKFDGTQVSVYDQWSIIWCSQGDKPCGTKTDTLAPGQCTTTTNPPCCREQCPDSHNVVEVVIH